MSLLTVKLIPILNDNYVFLIINGETKECVVVDPGEAMPVQEFIVKEGLKLNAILLTHHHSDHIGGACELKEQWQAQVFAPEKNRVQIPFANVYLSEAQTVSLLSDKLKLKVIELPGHTLGHIAYYNVNDNWLFSGDVLFGLGCGRLFEGSFAQGYSSLLKLKDLPNETKVFCTHEYTEANLKFCKSLMNSEDLQVYEHQLLQKRTAGIPSVPLNLGIEKQVNPFLQASDIEQFTSVRELKNRS